MSKIVNSIFEDIEEPTFLEKIKWAISRKYEDVTNFFKRIKERIKYGFPLYDSGEFHAAHSEWVIPRLKHLRNNLTGHPCGLSSIKEWEDILDKMIWSFEHYDDHVEPIYSEDYDHRYEVTYQNGMKTYTPMNKTGTIDRSPIIEHNNKVEKGLLLFSEYYRNLWD